MRIRNGWYWSLLAFESLLTELELSHAGTCADGTGVVAWEEHHYWITYKFETGYLNLNDSVSRKLIADPLSAFCLRFVCCVCNDTIFFILTPNVLLWLCTCL
jgi:hypothetical protein